MDPLKFSKNVNKSGLKTSNQITVTVRFAREIKLIPSKYVNIRRIYEGDAVFAMLFSWDKRGKFSKIDPKVDFGKYVLLNWCLCLILNHFLNVIQIL